MKTIKDIDKFIKEHQEIISLAIIIDKKSGEAYMDLKHHEAEDRTMIATALELLGREDNARMSLASIFASVISMWAMNDEGVANIARGVAELIKNKSEILEQHED